MSSGPGPCKDLGESSEKLRLKGDSSRCDLSVTQLSYHAGLLVTLQCPQKGITIYSRVPSSGRGQ